MFRKLLERLRGSSREPDDMALGTKRPGDFVEPGREYRFGLRKVKGQPNQTGIQVLGPWQPQNNIEPLGPLANIANPFNPLDVNPVLLPGAGGDPSAAVGSSALPYRPAPSYAAGFAAPNGQGDAARGLVAEFGDAGIDHGLVVGIILIHQTTPAAASGSPGRSVKSSRTVGPNARMRSLMWAGRTSPSLISPSMA